MKQLLIDFWNDRASALSVIRGIALGAGLYITGHEPQVPDWIEVGVALVNAILFGVSGEKKQ